MKAFKDLAGTIPATQDGDMITCIRGVYFEDCLGADDRRLVEAHFEKNIFGQPDLEPDQCTIVG